MSASIIEISRAGFARDLATVASRHFLAHCLFTEKLATAYRLLQCEYSSGLPYADIRDTAFVQVMWFLYDYAERSGPPSPMRFDQWTVSGAISSYLRQMHSAAPAVGEESQAIERCLEVCERANARFTSKSGWLPFLQPARSTQT